mmetsp:Transcript_22281/g.72012  ORF Transcript_22281/g.72012 Transcript_22281/m.72012 type:complete len:237 (-) Transcript_22281:416-1126(-)
MFMKAQELARGTASPERAGIWTNDDYPHHLARPIREGTSRRSSTVENDTRSWTGCGPFSRVAQPCVHALGPAGESSSERATGARRVCAHLSRRVGKAGHPSTERDPQDEHGGMAGKKRRDKRQGLPPRRPHSEDPFKRSLGFPIAAHPLTRGVILLNHIVFRSKEGPGKRQRRWPQRRVCGTGRPRLAQIVIVDVGRGYERPVWGLAGVVVQSSPHAFRMEVVRHTAREWERPRGG